MVALYHKSLAGSQFFHFSYHYALKNTFVTAVRKLGCEHIEFLVLQILKLIDSMKGKRTD